jgi:N-glycosylase/DNA lyase
VGASGSSLTVRFSGHVAASCCAVDYFYDLKAVMEEKAGSRFALWEATVDPSPGHEGYDVKYARLSFLPKVRKAMDEVGSLVQRRVKEFAETGEDGGAQFSELCFCVLTANYTAEGGARIQGAMGSGFEGLPRPELAKALKALGHRFPNARAAFIAENQRLRPTLQQDLKCFKTGMEAREWLVENVRGFGYKEASHFLRNTGCTDVAIIDRHILRFLVKEGLIEEPKAVPRGRYLSIERLLRGIAAELGVSLSELDLYLWYMMTGKVLK